MAGDHTLQSRARPTPGLQWAPHEHTEYQGHRRQHAGQPLQRKTSPMGLRGGSKRADLDVELLDLRDYPLPFFEEAIPPGWPRTAMTTRRS